MLTPCKVGGDSLLPVNAVVSKCGLALETRSSSRILLFKGVVTLVKLVFCLFDQYLKMFTTCKICHKLVVKSSNSNCVNHMLRAKLNLLTILSSQAFCDVIL